MSNLVNSPKISVIIYCHNNVNVVERALLSILNQDYKQKEIIIVDDASEDGSWGKICDLINRPQDNEDFITTNIISSTPVSAIRHEFETGLPGVFLTGANATWDDLDLIGLLRSNNEYLPGKLSKSVEYMYGIADKVGILYSDYETLIDGIPVKMYRQSFSRDRLNFGDTVLITKTAVKAVGMVNPDKGDLAIQDFCLRITGRFAAIHIPEILTKEIN